MAKCRIGGGRGGFRAAVRQAWRKRHNTWIPRLASLGMLALSQRSDVTSTKIKGRERERERDEDADD